MNMFLSITQRMAIRRWCRRFVLITRNRCEDEKRELRAIEHTRAQTAIRQHREETAKAIERIVARCSHIHVSRCQNRYRVSVDIAPEMFFSVTEYEMEMLADMLGLRVRQEIMRTRFIEPVDYPKRRSDRIPSSGRIFEERMNP